jgi:hypothetical protein
MDRGDARSSVPREAIDDGRPILVAKNEGHDPIPPPDENRLSPRPIKFGRTVEGGTDVPQDAAWLSDWQRRIGYTDQEACDALAMGLSTFRNQRTGRSRVSRQTARLALHVALHRIDWLELSDLSARLARALEQRKNGKRNNLKTL